MKGFIFEQAKASAPIFGIFKGIFKFLVFTLVLAACGGIVPPPPDTDIKPEVKSTSPADQEGGVAFNRAISVTFNKKMSPATVTKNSFFLEEDVSGIPVPGVLNVTGVSATLKPDALLLGDTSYVATLTTGIEDLSGNAIDQVHRWRFTTASAGSPGSTDDTPPVIVSTNPKNGAANVPTNTHITATFSEAPDPATVNFETFNVSKGMNAQDIFVSGTEATFIPETNLELGKDFTVTLTTGIKDLAGNPLSEAFIWSFSTGSEPPDDDG
ncbi:MAG: Ig-like domain-containing protein [Nitrospiria bacterium]